MSAVANLGENESITISRPVYPVAMSHFEHSSSIPALGIPNNLSKVKPLWVDRHSSWTPAVCTVLSSKFGANLITRKTEYIGEHVPASLHVLASGGTCCVSVTREDVPAGDSLTQENNKCFNRNE